MKNKKKIKVFYETVKDGVYQCGYTELTEEEYNALLNKEEETH